MQNTERIYKRSRSYGSSRSIAVEGTKEIGEIAWGDGLLFLIGTVKKRRKREGQKPSKEKMQV
jgi:hypothetical protein